MESNQRDWLTANLEFSFIYIQSTSIPNIRISMTLVRLDFMSHHFILNDIPVGGETKLTRTFIPFTKGA